MIDTLRRVRGAVSTKDLIPALTHFCIYEGRVQGANGRVCIDSEAAVPDDLNCIVPAEKFIKAIDSCEKEPTLTLKDGKLTVRAGKFRATMSVLPNDSYPRVGAAHDDDGWDEVWVPSDYKLLPVLKRLAPFISTDASRPWSQSILFSGGSAYASNNVVVARTPCDPTLDLVLPSFAIDELLRLGVEPISMLVSSQCLYFIFDGYWMRSQTLVDGWPNVSRLFEGVDFDALADVPHDLAHAVEKLIPFFPQKDLPVVYFGENGVSTGEGVSQACVECSQFSAAAFRLEPLRLVLAVATRLGLDCFPKPVPFAGDNIEGVLSGMRV